MGPTASGKTDLALALAERLPCDLISVDATQVYRGLDIGSAKPAPEVLARFPHRLIDICDPGEIYSAARFRLDALAAVREIIAHKRIPLLVGGTMLYFRALEYGLSPLPEADAKVRERLLAEGRELGWEALHRRLQAIDPQAAERIHPRDPQRIQRALEVYELSGRSLTELQQASRGEGCDYPLIKLARAPLDRAGLHRRLAERFQRMLAAGLEEEVRGLLARRDLSAELPALRAVGYRQVAAYLRGECSREEMIERAIAASRQLAKRQLTWLRADASVHWLWDEAGDSLGQALKCLSEAITWNTDKPPAE